MKEKTFVIPLYDFEVKLFKYQKEDKKLIFQDVDITPDGVKAYTFYYKTKPIKIFSVFNVDEIYKDDILMTSVHESLHITNFVMKHLGMKASFKNDEPQAYLLEFVTNEVFSFLTEKHKL